MSKQQFISDYRAIKNELKVYDGTEGKSQDAAIDKEANMLADAVTSYVERILQGKQCLITPADVVTAAFVSSTGPVTASGNLTGIIADKPV
jgi:hypothetical protein